MSEVGLIALGSSIRTLLDCRAPTGKIVSTAVSAAIGATLSGAADGHRRNWLVGSVGFFAGLIAASVVATSHHLVYAAPFAVLEAVEVWSSIAIGLFYWTYRPRTHVGSLLIAYGFVNALIGLEGSAQPLTSLIGSVAEVPAVVLIVYVILAYRRRVLDVPARCVLATWAALVVLEYALWFAAHPVLSVPTPLATCTAGCPPNLLYIPSAAPAIDPIIPWLDPAYRISIFILLASVFLMYLPTLRRSRAERRVMLPVLFVFSVWLAGSTLYGASQLSSEESILIFWVLYLGRLIFPLSFVAGLLVQQSFGARALETVLARVASGGEPTDDAAVAEALGGLGVRVDFWTAPPKVSGQNSSQRISTSGEPDRAMTELYRDGHLIGAIVSDMALSQDPELLEAAGRAITMTIEKRRLELELMRMRSAFSKSQEELAAAAENQRLRIQRDLHDSVQQELLASQARLEVVRAMVNDESVHQRLIAISADIDLALQHLRDVARGTSAAAMLRNGLRPALAEATARAPTRVRLQVVGPDRYPDRIEEAIYFCCLEALQNVEKHAGDVEQVTIAIRGSDDEVTFQVADYGKGFDPRHTAGGQGLANMAERMRAYGGWLRIESAVGNGTTIRGGVKFDRNDIPASGPPNGN